MYANILMSTDGSDVARKGVKQGLALAKAPNAKATVITVTGPLELDYAAGGIAGGWIPPKDVFDRFDEACKESAGKVLDEARAVAEQIGISVELLHVPNAYAATAIIDTAKSRGCGLNRHGLSWASRPPEAIIGESNIGGPSGRKRAGVGSVVAGCTLDFVSKPDVRFGSKATSQGDRNMSALLQKSDITDFMSTCPSSVQ